MVDDPPPPGTDEHHDRLERIVPVLQMLVIVGGVLLLVGLGGFLLGERSAQPSTSAIDVGFLHDMTNHHEQAIEMASIAVVTAEDPIVAGFAKEVLITQQRELGLMEAWLRARGEQRLGRDRIGMEWMDMAMPVASMPGMATDEQMDALRAAEGRDADVLFLELMREHHRGGRHMATDAADRATDADIAELAGVMARNQASEVAEYGLQLERLGAA